MNDEYLDLREQAFLIAPQDIGVYLENNEQVYAAIVDIPVNGKVATMFCTFDGTVSLYYSNGKCDIGLGNNENIRKASISFLVSSGQCLRFMDLCESKDIMEQCMKVFLFYKNGIKAKNICVDRLKTKEEKFLNFLIQNILSEIRKNQ